LDLFMLALADLYGANIEYAVQGVSKPEANGQAADLLQKYAARIQDARNRFGRPGWVPPFKPQGE
jgi:hypothetical protein